MRELFLKLFGNHEANEFTEISMFSWHHILYLVLTVGIVVALSIIFFKKSVETRKKVVDILGILIAVSYIADFFLQPLRGDGSMLTNGEIILDKFPFHICIVLCPLILYSRFGKYGKPLKTPVAIASSVAPLMWLIYPGTALDTDLSAFSYEIVQLFTYHGLVLIYGCVYIILRDDQLDIKKCYKEAILVLGITLWAIFGNELYSVEDHGYNWFFLVDPVFDFIPDAINPVVVPVIIYLSCLVVYGVYYLVIYLHNKLVRKEQ